MIHKAKDLSPDQKVAIESLLGRRVLEGEAVSVRAFEPPAISGERRAQITEELKRYFAEVDAHRLDVPAAEADEIIDKATSGFSAKFQRQWFSTQVWLYQSAT